MGKRVDTVPHHNKSITEKKKQWSRSMRGEEKASKQALPNNLPNTREGLIIWQEEESVTPGWSYYLLGGTERRRRVLHHSKGILPERNNQLKIQNFKEAAKWEWPDIWFWFVFRVWSIPTIIIQNWCASQIVLRSYKIHIYMIDILS